MCEFKVIIKGKTVFKDGNRVIVKDILGDSKEFKNCRIAEVDVNTVCLFLSALEH